MGEIPTARCESVNLLPEVVRRSNLAAAPSPSGRARLELRGLVAPALLLLVLGAQYHGALRWLLSTWTDASWGFVALLALPLCLRRMPARRTVVSSAYLVVLALLSLLDVALARLSLNVVSALVGLVSLHFWALAFFRYEGRWYAQRQLWLALLCLPFVHWANVLVGYPVRALTARAAATVLQAICGAPVALDGTMLSVGSTVLAVDTQCSGMKLLYCGLLFGLVAAPRGIGVLSRVWFWLALLAGLVAANVVRIISLSVAHLQRGQPVGALAHQAIGLLAFAMVCAALLVLARHLGKARRCTDTTGASAEASAEGTPASANSARRARRLAALLVSAIVLCAALRVGGLSRQRAALLPAPRLPATLLGRAGKATPFNASERRLTRAPHVTLRRRGYGPMQVALLTVQQSVKELHPPQVCLEAEGFEIVSKRRRALAGGGCVQVLRLRKKNRLSFFYYGYVSRGALTCSFWGRTGAAVWSRLKGQRRAWSTLQVMDRDPRRGAAAFEALVRHLRRATRHALNNQRRGR